MLYGSNISVIAGVMTALFGRIFGKRPALFVVVAGILLYTLLVGADGSVTRAAIMGILYAWAAYLGRQSTAIVSLFGASLIMSMVNPLILWDVGFQLSFMATLSLILFTPGMTAWFEEAMERTFGTLGGLLSRLAGHDAPRNTNQAWEPGSNSFGMRLRLLLTAFLTDALIVTLAAQVLTLPLVAFYFGRVSLVSPLANLLVLPVQPPIMIWGGLTVIVSLLAGVHRLVATFLWPLARVLAMVPWMALHWTVLVVKVLAPLPLAALNVHLSPLVLLVFYGLLATTRLTSATEWPLMGTALQRLRQALVSAKASTVATTLLLAACYLLLVAFRTLPDSRLRVHFLDLERGEAILIETPDGQQVLIDGGYGPTELLSALGEHMPFYGRKIELVVLTHPGDERIGGLVGLPARYQIGQVLQAPFLYPSAGYESWLRALQEHEVPVAPAEAGGRVELGYGITLDVLHPGPEPLFRRGSASVPAHGELDLKANSLVLRLSYGDTQFLLLGDISGELQEGLVDTGVLHTWHVTPGTPHGGTVVKLPDGGRQASFSEAFLAATEPDHAVAFVRREDRFRDLSAALEEAWKAVVGEERFHRTDLAGTVSFDSDGMTPRPAAGNTGAD